MFTLRFTTTDAGSFTYGTLADSVAAARKAAMDCIITTASGRILASFETLGGLTYSELAAPYLKHESLAVPAAPAAPAKPTGPVFSLQLDARMITEERFPRTYSTPAKAVAAAKILAKNVRKSVWIICDRDQDGQLDGRPRALVTASGNWELTDERICSKCFQVEPDQHDDGVCFLCRPVKG